MRRTGRRMGNSAEWCCGYFTAVALLLRQEGAVTTEVRELFAMGGPVDHAHPDDIALFQEYGLMPVTSGS
ncbi:hypothetical protein AB7849_19325 [Rhodanobacter sp. 115]|uniref:hypothetical protein n=1 Tax=Rhodanobacter sp. FW021-MT20 TaxID=1162282 RepID=UPI0034E5BA4B